MGIGAGAAYGIASLVVAAAGTAASYYMTPKMPMQDTTNYDMLAETQRKTDEESAAAKAKIDEARKREELRQQQLRNSNVLTSDYGDDDKLSVTETTLGKGR